MAISNIGPVAAANISAFGGVSKASISAINGITAGFGGGGGGFDFTTIQGSNLTVYTAARLETGKSDGDNLTSLVNSGVAGSSWAVPTTVKPVYKTNILNGQPVYRFTPGADRPRAALTGKTIYNLISTSAWTVFVVYKIDATGTNTGFSNGSGPIGEDGGVWGLVHDSTGHSGKIVGEVYDGGVQEVEAGTYSSGVGQIVEFRRTGGNVSLRLNGGAAVTAATSALHASFGGVPQIGRRGSVPSNTLEGDIAEYLVWNIDLGGTDTTTVRNELATIYGVTV